MNLAGVFAETLNVTLPVFAMVFMGLALKRIGWIDRTFIDTASALVFKATMPTLIFLSLIHADMEQAFDPKLMAFFGLTTVALFLLSWAWSLWRVSPADRGVYVQGAFRGNCGIVGLALAAGMYGDYGLSAGGLLLGVVILSYNILSVFVLVIHGGRERANWHHIFRHIALNPLILAVLAALPFMWFQITLPTWLMTSGEYFASLTLPLALICIGGTLSIRGIKESRHVAIGASLMKMVTLPILGTLASWWAGFSGRQLGLLFLYFASPTAAASFVMVKAMGGNAKLAANIIAISTLLASLTITGGVFALRALDLI
ncbi:AEC family transporter [Aidingimonas lacisalsi]|uniref:AEC family transporter n=1 Tax=Aidingimonas lacisalsi TaxID=2604086 RepID=UPI0011D2AE4F|nr:AEC family transporter [Aidingimonas lacisalsi]